MKDTTHFYSLSPEWQCKFIQESGIDLVDDKILVIPDKLGVGHTYFSQVLPGISVFLRDYVLKQPLTLDRGMSQDEFYIFNYDFVEDQGSNESVNFEFSILNNQITNTYMPAVNTRTFGLSLFIEKAKMHDYVNGIAHSEFLKKQLNASNKLGRDYVSSIDLILLLSIKEKSIFKASFEFFLKGIALKLMANFLDRSKDLIPVEELVL